MSKKRDWFKWKLRAGTRGTIRRASRRTGNGFEAMGACVAMLDHARNESHYMDNPEGVFKTSIEDLSIDYTTPEPRIREALGALIATGWLNASHDVAIIEADAEIAFRIIRYLAFNDPQGSDADRQAAARDRKAVSTNAAAYRFLLDSDVDAAMMAEVLDLRGNVTDRHDLSRVSTRREEKRREEGNTSSSAEPTNDIPRMLFNRWLEKTGRNPNQNRLTKARRSMVNARLRDGYPVSQLEEAIDGIAASPWHQGANPQSKRYDTFDFIMRSGENVEKGSEANSGSSNAAAAGVTPDQAAMIAALPKLDGAA